MNRRNFLKTLSAATIIPFLPLPKIPAKPMIYRMPYCTSSQKKALSEYWKNMIGFPDAYVNAMIHDYKQ